MSWHLASPKTLHLYWGGDNIPYIRMLTAKSFIKHNPGWKVILYRPTETGVKRTWETRELNYPVLCENCIQELLSLPVEVKEVDFRQFGFDNTMSEVHKSDFLRLELLADVGGVWSDMDIIYFKSMEHMKINTEANKDIDTFVCIGHYGHSAGFLMSAQGSKYYRMMASYAKTNYDPKLYQGIGATMFNDKYPTLETIRTISPKTVNIPMDTVYAHDAMNIKQIMDGTPARFTDESIGIHWYAGYPSWGEFIKNTNGGKQNLPPCIITNVIQSITI